MSEADFIITSAVFDEGSYIPLEHTCEGENTIPPLSWQNIPDDTHSFALVMDDPDAPSGTFTHWVVFDLPAGVCSLPSKDGRSRGINGKNDFDNQGYGGPCPPQGHGDHRYYFRLYALDISSLMLPSGAERNAVEHAMEGHVLSKTQLMGLYRRE